jgi:hypothetical protein
MHMKQASVSNSPLIEAGPARLSCPSHAGVAASLSEFTPARFAKPLNLRPAIANAHLYATIQRMLGTAMPSDMSLTGDKVTSAP